MDYSRFGMPAFSGINKRDFILALVSGALLALIFPKPGLSFVAWFAFVPLLLACGKKSPGKAFKLGFLAGTAGYAGILYWINIVVTTYGKLPIILSIGVFMILVCYMASYVAVFMYLVRKGEEKGIPVLVSFPVLWVGLEYLRSFLVTGFPWAILGYSQYEILPLIQVSDITGVYGVSFLIALANVAFYGLIKGMVTHEKTRPGRGVLVFLLLLAVTLGYGFLRLSGSESGTSMRVALIQGNIDQAVKWDPAYQEATVSIYERLTKQAGAPQGADLVVWPESATPFYLQDAEKYLPRITGLASLLNANLVVGSPAYDDEGGVIRYRNSAYLISPKQEIVGRSDKIHLVPFGEYVPMAKLLPFVRKLVVGDGDGFSPGKGTVPLSTDKGEIGILVCFEGIFPELSRGYVQAGSRVLVNITNDAWYGSSSAPYQHLSMTVFRAVENRVPLVRAANTGISAIINSEGKITGKTEIFKQAFLNGKITLGSANTLYSRYGDVFAKFCLCLSVLITIIAFTRKKRSKRGLIHV